MYALNPKYKDGTRPVVTEHRGLLTERIFERHAGESTGSGYRRFCSDSTI